MASSGRARRTSAAVILSLIATSIVTVATPAVASYYEDGVSFSGDIVRNGLSYRLTVKALRAMGSRTFLEVTVSRREEAGSITLRQTQNWTFVLAEDDSFYSDDTGWHIDVGGEENALDVQVDLATQSVTCEQGQALFVTQPEGGAFRIETGNEVFGTITELPPCGEFYSYSSGQLPWPPCPNATQAVYSEAITVLTPRRDEGARIRVSDGGLREVTPGHGVPWSVSLKGAVPLENFHLGSRLGGGLDVGAAPWLEGKATFEPLAPKVERGWTRCGREGAREYRSVERRVAITGDLTFDVIGYERVAITDPDALALRWWVRPRT